MIQLRLLRWSASLIIVCLVLSSVNIAFAQPISPKQLKLDSIQMLQNIEIVDKIFKKQLDEIIGHIQDSLGNEKVSLWQDEWHLLSKEKDWERALRVFHEEKNAVKDLLENKGKGSILSSEIKVIFEKIIENLTLADKLLAERAIYQAEVYKEVGKRIDHQINLAKKELAQAEEEMEKDSPDQAIKKYEKAWEHAQLALNFVTPEIAAQAATNWLLKMEEAFTAGSWEDLSAAAASLKEIGEAATPELLNIFTNQSKDEIFRKMAAELIAEIGDEGAVASLIEVLQNENEAEFVRAEAAYTLGRLGDTQALNSLMDALNDDNEQISSMAALGLGLLEDEQAVPVLIVRLSDENEMVRIRAGRALAQLKAQEAFNAFIELLSNDPSENVRGLAALWLGNLGDIRAMEPLINVLSDENENIACNAATALGMLKDTRAVSPLIAVLEREGLIRIYAAQALAEIGDINAAEPLKEIIKVEVSDWAKEKLIEAYEKLTGEEYQE